MKLKKRALTVLLSLTLLASVLASGATGALAETYDLQIAIEGIIVPYQRVDNVNTIRLSQYDLERIEAVSVNKVTHIDCSKITRDMIDTVVFPGAWANCDGNTVIIDAGPSGTVTINDSQFGDGGYIKDIAMTVSRSGEGQITVTAKVDGKSAACVGNAGNPMTVRIPYAAGPGANIADLAVYTMTDGLRLVLPEGLYSPENKVILLKTTRLGTFTVFENDVLFRDILDGLWYTVPVGFLASREIVRGMYADKKLYEPDLTLTRAQLLKMLALCSDGISPDSAASCGFADVEAGAWYEAYVNWGAEAGLVKGYGDGTVKPDVPVTREQLCVMLSRFAGAAGLTLPASEPASAFTDGDTISPWAFDAVMALHASGFVGGRDNGDFDPQAPAMRSEAAKVVCALLIRLITD